MTLVEILVSAVILFVVLTGVLGLVGTTTNMSVMAKQQNVATNAVSAYVEQLHSLPFEDVDVEDPLGVEPGVLSATETIDVGEFQVTIVPTVTEGANDFLKSVRLDITVTRVGVQVQTFTTTVIIRDRSQHVTQSARTPETDPSVEFTTLSAPDGAVTWDNQWSGGALNIQIEATPSEGRVIERVAFYAGGFILHDASSVPAEWYEIGEEVTWINSPAFVWNTAHMILDDDGTYRPAFPNGWTTVTVLVYDNYGGEAMATRKFYLDNQPPGIPGAPYVVENPSRPNPDVIWEPASGIVYGYELELRKQGSTQTGTHSPFDETEPWNVLLGYDGPDAVYALNSTPFSRYAGRVFSKGARYDIGFLSNRSEWVEGDIFTTRPRLGRDYRVTKTTTGNPGGRGWTVTANLVVTEPTFPTVGAVDYNFYRVVNGALQEPPLQSGASNTFTHAVEALGANPTSANFPVTDYAVVVKYIPAGFAGGNSEVIRSNTVRTAYQNNAGTYTFTEGTW